MSKIVVRAQHCCFGPEAEAQILGGAYAVGAGVEEAVLKVLGVPRGVRNAPSSSVGTATTDLIDLGAAVEIDVDFSPDLGMLCLPRPDVGLRLIDVGYSTLFADAIAMEIREVIELGRRQARAPIALVGEILREASPQSLLPAVCPDCKGTKIYVGAAFYPAEPCRTCCGPSTPVASLDDDELPEGLVWREYDRPHYFPHCIRDTFSGDGIAIRRLTGRDEGGGAIMARPDHAHLVALLRRKNGLT